MDIEKLWKSVLGELELSISPTYYNTFLSDTKIKLIEENKLEVICKNGMNKDLIKNRFGDKIKEVLEKRTKKDLQITFKSEKGNTDYQQSGSQQNTNPENAPLFNRPQQNIVKESELSRQQQQKSSVIKVKEENKNVGLLPEYNFENFIIGPNNRLAYTVAKSVAENPGTTHNPFLIYSGVGLGKTHLLQAIGNKIAKNKPDLKILYCTGQEFLNEIMAAFQRNRSSGGTLKEFKNKFINTDVWLIDDIQIIAGRESTQEEFYFIFNTLYLNKKQIVLSTDRHPSEISKLEERLSSRFNMGMIADIQKPDIDIRTAILRNKRDISGIDIDNETIDYIADNITSNIRELEGAFIQVITYAKTMDRKPDIETAKQALGSSLVSKEEKNIKPNKVIREISKFYNVDIRDIKGKRRTKEVVLPRQVAMYLLKEINQLPLMDIGAMLGGRDHTTIMYGADKIKKEVANENYKLKKEISIIKESILENR